VACGEHWNRARGDRWSGARGTWARRRPVVTELHKAQVLGV
jgi:hypothetical protein